MSQSEIPRCCHIKANGLQCGSPALSRAPFCYFHQRWRETRPNRRRPANAAAALDLPLLEDANAIQLALQQVMAAIIHNQIDNKKAGLLLFALQTASSNLKRTRFEPFRSDLLGQELEEPDPSLEPDADSDEVLAEQGAAETDEMNDGRECETPATPVLAPVAAAVEQKARVSARRKPSKAELDAEFIREIQTLAGITPRSRNSRAG